MIDLRHGDSFDELGIGAENEAAMSDKRYMAVESPDTPPTEKITNEKFTNRVDSVIGDPGIRVDANPVSPKIQVSTPPTEEALDDYLTDPLALAVLFHATYERLAPNSGYETRKETRIFDPESANGKTMLATCEAVQKVLARARQSPSAKELQGARGTKPVQDRMVRLRGRATAIQDGEKVMTLKEIKQIVAATIDTYTGPTGGWLGSPYQVREEIADALHERFADPKPEPSKTEKK